MPFSYGVAAKGCGTLMVRKHVHTDCDGCAEKQSNMNTVWYKRDVPCKLPSDEHATTEALLLQAGITANAVVHLEVQMFAVPKACAVPCEKHAPTTTSRIPSVYCSPIQQMCGRKRLTSEHRSNAPGLIFIYIYIYLFIYIYIYIYFLKNSLPGTPGNAASFAQSPES